MCASDESVVDNGQTETLGPDHLMEALLHKKKSACDLGEGAECPTGSKDGDKCCYLEAGKQKQGICKSTSHLQVLTSGGHSLAGIFVACFSKSVAHKFRPEVLEWDYIEEDASVRATKSDCVTHEGVGCPPGLKENDKCCYFAGGKKVPGVCSEAASIEVIQEDGRSIAAEVVGCFAKAIAK